MTSLRRGRAILRTSRTGFRPSRPPSTARCRMPPSRSSACRTDTRPGAVRHAIGLPARDHVRRQLGQLQLAQVGLDVQVVQARVVLGRLRRQRHRVRLRPRLSHVVIERLAGPGEAHQVAEPPAAPDLILERLRVGLAVERPRACPRSTPTIAPAHLPAHCAVAADHPVNAHAARSPSWSIASPSTRRRGRGRKPGRAALAELISGAGRIGAPASGPTAARDGAGASAGRSLTTSAPRASRATGTVSRIVRGRAPADARGDRDQRAPRVQARHTGDGRGLDLLRRRLLVERRSERVGDPRRGQLGSGRARGGLVGRDRQVRGRELDRVRPRRLVRPHRRRRCTAAAAAGRGAESRMPASPRGSTTATASHSTPRPSRGQQLARRARALRPPGPQRGHDAASSASSQPSARSAAARAASSSTSLVAQVKAAQPDRRAVLGQQQPDAALPGRDRRARVPERSPSPGRGSCPRPAACCSAAPAGTRTGPAAPIGTTSEAGFCVAAHTITPAARPRATRSRSSSANSRCLLAVLAAEVERQLVAGHQVQRQPVLAR